VATVDKDFVVKQGLSIALDKSINFSNTIVSTTADTWIAENSNFGNTTINSVAYGNSLWIVGADGGQLRTSTDGITWTTQTSNFGTSAINSIAYGNNLWIAVGDGGQLRTSTDGTTWTTQTSNFGTTIINSIAYGNSLWIAGGATGQLRTSTDGITWTTQTSNFGNTFIWSVAYGNSLWIAGADAGQLRTSTDGITWTTQTSNFGTTVIRSVAYGNDLWIAGGVTGQIRRSLVGTKTYNSYINSSDTLSDRDFPLPANTPIRIDNLVSEKSFSTLENKILDGTTNTITNVSLTTGITGTLAATNGGTGITSLGTGIATFLGTPSSSNLRSAITDETGSGSLVFGTSPTIDTPTLTLSSTSSTTSGRISFDSTNDKIIVGDGSAAVEFAPSTILTSSQSTTTYTLVLSDKDKMVELSNAAAITLYVPTNSLVAFPVGSQINILQTGVGQVTVAASSPGTTTINGTPTLSLRAQWSAATLIKRSTDSWVLIGDLST
jgi:hypothetical protein